MVQAVKYRGKLGIARELGQMLADSLIAVCPDAAARWDHIVPMPLHRTRLRQRGFNQAVELARPVAAALRIPLALDQVRRIVATASQTDLPLADRQANMRGAFSCAGDVAGRSILLLDDVMTTGASLDALATELRRQGARTVDNAVLARTFSPGHHV